MESAPTSEPRLSKVSLLVAVIATMAVFWLFAGPRDRLWGDEPTYLAMATSLARDGDMKFTEPDRAWAVERSPGGLILQRGEAGERAPLGYSKPVVYPLLAALFVRFLGEGGMLACNFVLVAFAMGFAWDYLVRLGGRGAARATWLTFLVASPILPYLFWGMSESTQVALSVSGLVLTCRDLRWLTPEGASGRSIDLRRIVVGGVLLGLLVTLRLPNVIVALAPVAAWAVYRRPKVSLVLLASIIAAVGAATVLTAALTGAPNPYRAVRTSFDERTGYPQVSPSVQPSNPVGTLPLGETASDSGDESGEGHSRFETSAATHRAYWRLLPEWNRSVYAALYALVGRHTGLLLYFPALWVLVTSLRPLDRLGVCLLLAAAGLLAFYLLWLPGNYFGGSTFIGNRYWLAGYPLLMIAQPRLPSRRAFAFGWVFTAAVWGSAIVGVVEARAAGQAASQAHTHHGIFPHLPAESSAVAIDGWTSRQWSGDVLRFVNPHARLAESGFELRAGDGAAEVLLAREPRGEPGAPLLFAARAEGDGTLRIRDWRRNHAEALGAGRAAFIAFEPATSWRHHPTTPGPARELFALDFEFEGERGTVEVRYLGLGTSSGEPLEPARTAAYRVRRASLPETGFAGSTGAAWIGVRNRSTWTWSSHGVLPIHLRYSFRPLEGGEDLRGPPLTLPTPVEPGGTLRMPFDVRWPDQPGRYELTVELEEALFGPLSERAGEPIARQLVTVGPNQAAVAPGTG